MTHLPKPECSYGYTQNQLDAILKTKRAQFNGWFSGQTAMMCDDHGLVVYPWDLTSFLAGLRVRD